MCTNLAASPHPFRSIFFRPLFVCEASADACAEDSSAGLGGFIRLPDGRQACFAQTLSAQQLSDFFQWFPSDTSPQHCIAAWEMLAQVALLWLLSQLLPPGHVPFHVVFRTDQHHWVLSQRRFSLSLGPHLQRSQSSRSFRIVPS